MAAAQLTPVGVGIPNVLIATDFSLFASVCRWHSYTDAGRDVYVLPTEEYVLSGPEGLHAGTEAARRDLLDFKSGLHNLWISWRDTDCHVSMSEGPVTESILLCARERKADLIVVGTHRRGGFGKGILGSVAEDIFRHSQVPVLTVGPSIRALSRSSTIHSSPSCMSLTVLTK